MEKSEEQPQVQDLVGELYADHLQAHTKNLLLKKDQVPDQVEDTSDDSIAIFYKINTSWLIYFFKKYILFLYQHIIALGNKIKCSHILVEKQSQALQLLEEIKKGKKFGAVAREVSTCPSSKKDGDLGYFTKGMMVKEFDEVAFKLQIGEVSEPVKTQFGYHLIKRLS